MSDAARKPISIRLTDEEAAALPDCPSPSEAIRQLMAKGARHQSVETLLDARLAALHEGVETAVNRHLAAAAAAERRADVALEMILLNLRALYHGLLRTEAVATAALYGLADQEATGEDMEAQLTTRFEEHLGKLWPLFLAENEEGLRSLGRGGAPVPTAPESASLATVDGSARAADDAA